MIQLFENALAGISSHMLGNKKAASVILEQVFIVVFGVMILVLVVLVFTTVRDESADFIAENQYELVANSIHSGIALAAKNMKFSDNGRIVLDIPDKIAGASYKISIVNNTTINVTDTQGVKGASVPLFNMNATVRGNPANNTTSTFTGGGRIFIEYDRNSSTITIRPEERVISS